MTSNLRRFSFSWRFYIYILGGSAGDVRGDLEKLLGASNKCFSDLGFCRRSSLGALVGLERTGGGARGFGCLALKLSFQNRTSKIRTLVLGSLLVILGGVFSRRLVSLKALCTVRVTFKIFRFFLAGC